ncbi:TPA: terminase large subunit [Vibrio alginolyticus]
MKERLREIAEEAYERAFEYVEEIHSGSRPSSKLVYNAVNRFKNDLKRCEDENERIFWDKEEAIKALMFLSMLPLVDGQWQGKRLELMPFHAFVVINIYGFWEYRNNDPKPFRRFRKAHVSVPRKSAKSTLSGGIALYETIREAGSQVYSAATTRDQAKMCWESAKSMIAMSPLLKKLFGFNNQLIYQHADNSFYKAVASDSSTLDGLNVQLAIIDEYHAHKDGSLYNIMLTGMSARRDPLILSITTAGKDLSSHCLNHENKTMKPIVNGIIEDDSFFVLIYGIDEGDDVFDEKTWWKANPALGISKDIEDLRSAAIEAKQMPYMLADFKTKHLNIWVNTNVEWLNMEAWAKCPNSVSDDELIGKPCYIGVDKARVGDFTSITALFKLDDGTYDIRAYSLLPEESVEKQTAEYKQLLKRFVTDKWLTLTDGNIISDDVILDHLRFLINKFDVKEVVFDNYGSTNLQYTLQSEGIPVVAVSQSTKTMSEPMGETESMILSQRLRNPRNSVLTWALGNVVLKNTEAKNLYPTKANANSKIDPAMALFMALNRAIINKDISLDGFLDNPIMF